MYKRIGNYKDPGSPGFYYVDMITNKKITNNNIIARIKNMKIPPNYNDVIINDKNGKILAYGYDSKKRKQIIYNPLFVNKRTVEKYNKISSLNNKNIFKKILNDINKNIKDSGNSDAKLKEISIIIYLIVNCGFRIGNKKYRDENNSFGISTIKFKHIKFNTDHIVINFIGKKGVENKSKCSNTFICKYLKNKKNAGGSSDNSDNRGSRGSSDVSDNRNDRNVFEDIDSKDVNKYLQRYHDGLTSKDLRTWNANYLFLEYYKKHKKTGVKNPVKRAIEDVAIKLHNSYSICKKNYIDPNIVEKIKNDN